MARVSEIRYVPGTSQRARTEQDIEMQRNALANHRAQIESIALNVERFSAERTFWEVMSDYSKQIELPNFHAKRNATSRLSTILSELAQQISTCNQRTARYEAAVRDTTQTLRQNEMRLSMLPPTTEFHFTQASIKEMLKGLPVSNISLHEEGRCKYIRMVFKNVIMRPDRNDTFAWIDNGERPYIKLAPIVATFNMTHSEVKFLPMRNSSAGEPRIYPEAFSGRRQAHPHITGQDGSPCLGDFGGPLTEALSNGDIQTAATVALLFLQQAYAADGAGRYWHRWITRQLSPTGFTGWSDHARISYRTQFAGQVQSTVCRFVKTFPDGSFKIATVDFDPRRVNEDQWPRWNEEMFEGVIDARTRIVIATTEDEEEEAVPINPEHEEPEHEDDDHEIVEVAEEEDNQW